MQSNVFIRIIQTEYRSMITEKNGEWVKNPSPVESYVMNVPDEAVLRFKQWFKFAMSTTELTAGKTDVTPEEVFVFAATLKADMPPHDHVYPDILEVIKLFEENELVEVFGQKLAQVLISEASQQ